MTKRFLLVSRDNFEPFEVVQRRYALKADAEAAAINYMGGESRVYEIVREINLSATRRRWVKNQSGEI